MGTMLFNEEQAAKHLNVAVQTMRNWRHMRRGPKYVKLRGGGDGSRAAVRYRMSDLEAFIEESVIDPAAN